jgi:hypothetical protein
LIALQSFKNQKTKEENVVRKRLKIAQKSAKNSRRLAMTIIVIAAMTIIATGAVISRQKVNVKEESNAQAVKTPATNAANRTYTTVKVAGQEVQVDSQTGQIKELTPEEAQKLAAGLKQNLNRSTEGLVEERNPDGSVSIDLQGRFENVTVARTNDDGSVTTGCVDNAKAAGEFFGIDPQLIEDQPNSSTINKTGKKQPRTTTPRN